MNRRNILKRLGAALLALPFLGFFKPSAPETSSNSLVISMSKDGVPTILNDTGQDLRVTFDQDGGMTIMPGGEISFNAGAKLILNTD